MHFLCIIESLMKWPHNHMLCVSYLLSYSFTGHIDMLICVSQGASYSYKYFSQFFSVFPAIYNQKQIVFYLQCTLHSHIITSLHAAAFARSVKNLKTVFFLIMKIKVPYLNKIHSCFIGLSACRVKCNLKEVEILLWFVVMLFK